MKKLPVGIQSFAKIRRGNYCYADKTPLVAQLIEQGEFYFLSRPRRFGKSLLIDTIAEVFSGNRELFTGLYLEKNRDWNLKNPVIKIDFAQGVLSSKEQLDATVLDMLQNQAELYDITLKPRDIHLVFAQLLRELNQQTGRGVVVLVDEYDKPILDNITDTPKATEMRNALRNIYSVLKAQDAHLRFVMLTGVSKFSKVSLFSGLNNLEDITLDRRFGSLCGYTQQDLETVFQEYLQGLNLKSIKEWYNGYNFLGEPVYNPFDILLYLRNREFKPYWFETGTPTFLTDLLHARQMSSAALEHLDITDLFMSSLDVDNIEPQPLLFQTGYLTIRAKHDYPGGIYYTLGFPNQEVRHAFHDALLNKLCNIGQKQDENKFKLLQALQQNGPDALRSVFHAFFASIPHDWYRKNELANYEGYYCSIVYSYFAALGLDVTPEDSTNHGRIDMTVSFEDRIYLIEFKVNELTKTETGTALEQIKKKKYAEKYQDREVYLIGVEFSKTERNISRFEWEKALCGK